MVLGLSTLCIMKAIVDGIDFFGPGAVTPCAGPRRRRGRPKAGPRPLTAIQLRRVGGNGYS